MKNKIKFIAVSLAFCSMLFVIGEIFRYILVDDTASYTRIAFHEMYEQDNIDILFVGSSHCYRSFIPEVFDKELGVNTFNGGTSSQMLDGSYMVIKEVARHNDVKHIYLELYYNCAFSKYKNRTEMTQTYIIADYLKPSLDKVQYLLNASTKEHYLNSFILARRNWSEFFDADYVKNLIIKKGTDDYKDYKYTYVTRDLEWYAGKGYVANNEMIGDWNYFSKMGWGNINVARVSDDWLNSLEDIINFCDKRGISLTLISAPMSNFLLAGAEDYDEYVELVQNIIKGTNVNYYDFNLCKEEYFPNTSSFFKDADHMNSYGAEVFSHLFADFLNGKISENELFYDSYEEKLENLELTVFGISYHDKSEQIRDCKVVSTGKDNLEYEIIILPEGEEPYMLQEFSNNRFFTITPEEHGVITISYRLSNFPDKVQTIDITY